MRAFLLATASAAFVVLGCANCPQSGESPDASDERTDIVAEAEEVQGQPLLPDDPDELRELVHRIAKEQGFGEFWADHMIYDLISVPERRRKMLADILEGEAEAKKTVMSEPKQYDIAYLALFDVSGHPGHGGRNLYLWGDGKVVVRVVSDSDAEGWLYKDFEGKLDAERTKSIEDMLGNYGFFSAVVADHPVDPGAVISSVLVELADGQAARKPVYIDNEHPVMAPIYKHLLEVANEVAKGEPKIGGHFSAATPHPDGFNPKSDLID